VLHAAAALAGIARTIATLTAAFASLESEMVGDGTDLVTVPKDGASWERFAADDEDVKSAMEQFKARASPRY
jgi:hypothetical protein